MEKAIYKPSIRQRVKESIMRMIGDEMILPGEKIQPQNELAARFSTTPVTIHKALRELVQEGVVERRKGVGTFVSRRPVQRESSEQRVCLVLHRAGLDRPEINPEYWPYMQDLFFDFTSSLCETYSFSVKFAGPQINIARLISELQGYHSVFFHYSNEVSNDILKAVVRSRAVPVVKIGKMQEKLDCLLLDHDRFDGLRTGAEYLVHLGHKSIAYVGATQWWGDLGLAGFRSAISAANLPEDAARIIRVSDERAGGVDAADKLLALPHLPDAVMVDSDLRAIGLVSRLRENRVRIPEDISVMSHDGLQFATYNPPYLTSIKIPYGEMIRVALEEVTACNGKVVSHKVLTFPGKIIEGRTTAPRGGALSAGQTASEVLAV